MATSSDKYKVSQITYEGKVSDIQEEWMKPEEPGMHPKSAKEENEKEKKANMLVSFPIT